MILNVSLTHSFALCNSVMFNVKTTWFYLEKEEEAAVTV